MKLKKPKLDIKDLTNKIEQGASALNELTAGTVIVHSNRSFNTEISGDDDSYIEVTDTLGVNPSEQKTEGFFVDLVTI